MAFQRKAPKEVQDMFNKYIEQNAARRLDKPDAIAMLQTEFSLAPETAEQMFETFDKDMNGIMSIWEFSQFYQCVGHSAAAMVEKFKELDADGSGLLDVKEAREGLKSMKDATGRCLEDREIEFFIKTSLKDENHIDLGHFANLLARLKLYKGPVKRK